MKTDGRIAGGCRDAVQPVMIYQGEILVREGSQIDATVIEKLKLLGLTSQNTSIFPIVAMILALLYKLRLWRTLPVNFTGMSLK